jgi:glucose uptake protein
MVAAFWGVFIWKEFKNAPKGVNPMLALMFLLYIVGLVLIIAAKLV